MPLSKKAWEEKKDAWASDIQLKTDNVVLHVKKLRDEENRLMALDLPDENVYVYALIKSFEILEAAFDDYPKKESAVLDSVSFSFDEPITRSVEGGEK